LHYNRKFLNFVRKSLKEITNEDIKRYLANLKHKLLIEVCRALRLRVSGIIKLKIKDIDLEEGIIRVNLSNGEKECQPILSKRAIKDLENFLQKEGGENP